MAEQEKPQGDRPKRRSSRKVAKVPTSTAVATNGGARGARPPRHHVKGTAGGLSRSPRSPESGGGLKPQPGGKPQAGGAPEARARGWWPDFMRYLRSVKTEFLRVTWPTRKELKMATMVVVATLIILTLYLFVTNVIFTAIFSRL